MARPPEKLAQSLEVLRNLQTAEEAGAIWSRDLSRTHRERLLRNGFLQMRGTEAPEGRVPGSALAFAAALAENARTGHRTLPKSAGARRATSRRT